MSIPSPFHERTSKLCASLRWKDWAGYFAVCSYDTHHDREYFAFRNAVGMIDVSPLFKYEVKGRDAAAYLAKVMTRDIRKLKIGRVTYCCWCDDEGKVVDDGTVTRMASDVFRVTAAEASWAWLTRYARGFEVTVSDITEKIAALSVQGPMSRALLHSVTQDNVDDLKFFAAMTTKLDGIPVVITRTGYTGDLGYEIWTENQYALKLWDSLMANGAAYGIEPCGLDALDVTRIEAGFVMNGVDYFSANHCLIESRKSSPYEMGLGWTVQLKREPFNGQAALKAEKKRGSDWLMMGLEMDFPAFEAVCARYGLPPQIPSGAWRTGIPIYNREGVQIGYASSGAWSPLLKRNYALATLQAAYARPGTVVKQEITVEYHRHQVDAVVVATPFFDPERKRS